MQGIIIFANVAEAVRNGYEVISPFPDSEGYLHARIRIQCGWAQALIETKHR